MFRRNIFHSSFISFLKKNCWEDELIPFANSNHLPSERAFLELPLVLELPPVLVLARLWPVLGTGGGGNAPGGSDGGGGPGP